MTHLSLYRRFRPAVFEDLVRQEHVVRVLKNQVKTGAVGHAYLFCGPRGTGKTTVARIFSRAVNCLEPKDGSPCGTCQNCRALSEGSLDVVEIDAASNNGVNEMRDLREKVQYPPVTGKYKVYIIDEVHMLTDSAFNALLKTLEEPPRHAIFLLATTEPHKIPATILSRCMRLDFKLIPEEDLERHLIRILDEIHKPYEREAVSAIARAGAGSDRDMLSIAEMCLSYEDKLSYEGVTAVLGSADFSQICNLAESLLLADMPQALEQTERILSEGKAVGVLCRDLLETLNRIAIAKNCRNAEKLLSLPKKDFERTKEIASRSEGEAILRATEILSKAETDLKFVSSPRICLETALMRISLPSADGSAEALSSRVALLEKKLENSGQPPARTQNFEPKPPKPAAKAEPEGERMPKAPFETPFVPEPKKETQNPFGESEEGAASDRAQITFGKFIHLLRKSVKNGVLFTMCADLEAAFEGEKLILTTQSGTVFRSLGKEEHKKAMTEAFLAIGVQEFEVRFQGEKAPGKTDAIEKLKRDFRDTPIEVK